MTIIYFIITVLAIVATGLLAGGAGLGLLYWSVTRNYDSDECIEQS